jgi:hypothetical protein
VGASLLALIVGLQICDIVWKRNFADAKLKVDTLFHHCVIVFSSFMGLELPHKWLWHRFVRLISYLDPQLSSFGSLAVGLHFSYIFQLIYENSLVFGITFKLCNDKLLKKLLNGYLKS